MNENNELTFYDSRRRIHLTHLKDLKFDIKLCIEGLRSTACTMA